MRAIFLFLVFANLLFLAIWQGYLGNVLPDTREPQRLQKQIAAEQIVLLNSEEFNQRSSAKLIATTTNSTAMTELKACLEWGPLTKEQLQTIQPQIATLQKLNSESKFVVSNVQPVEQWLVLIPPLKSKADADKKAQELRNLGIKDYVVLQDGPNQFGISLGVFKLEEGAKTRLAEVTQQGVRSAKLIPRHSADATFILQLRDWNSEQQEKLTQWRKNLNAPELKTCKN